jgi:hypothetical protein
MHLRTFNVNLHILNIIEIRSVFFLDKTYGQTDVRIATTSPLGVDFIQGTYKNPSFPLTRQVSFCFDFRPSRIYIFPTCKRAERQRFTGCMLVRLF